MSVVLIQEVPFKRSKYVYMEYSIHERATCSILWESLCPGLVVPSGLRKSHTVYRINYMLYHFIGRHGVLYRQAYRCALGYATTSQCDDYLSHNITVSVLFFSVSLFKFW